MTRLSREELAQLRVLVDDAGPALFESSVVPSLLIDLDAQRIEHANEAACELLGFARRDIVGRPGADFLADPTPDQLLRARGVRRERTLTVRVIRTAGGLRTVELNIAPTSREHLVLVQAIDITSELAAAADAESRVETLERASVALESIGRRLAHDMRNPLTVIGGFVDLIKTSRDSFEDHELDEMLERVSSNVQGLAAMCESMLDDAVFAEQSGTATSYAVSDLFEVIRRVCAAPLAAADATLETTATVHELPVPVGAVRHAVLNLVSNAIKYGSFDGPPQITLSVDAADGEVVIAVSDEGPGLGPDPGSLLETGVRGRDREDDGSGLGLAFVHRAAEALGGQLTATNRDEGRGARFEIILPALGRGGSEPDAGRLRGLLTARQFADVLDASRVATVVVDLSARQIVHVNRAAVRLLGMDADELVGHTGRDLLVDPTDGDRLRHESLQGADLVTSTHSTLHTANGDVPVEIVLGRVPSSTLAIVQITEEAERRDPTASDPVETTSQAAAPGRDVAGSEPDRAADSGRRVLLVDHDLDHRLLASARLVEAGLSVEAVDTLHEAVDLLEVAGDVYDVVVAELVLPDHDGGHAVDLLVAASPTPVVVCSAASAELCRRARAQGAEAVVSKFDPDPDVLAAAVLAVLDGRVLVADDEDVRRAGVGFEAAAGALLDCLAGMTGVDTWMVTRVIDDEWTVLVARDPEYGLQAGDALRWSDSVCSRMVAHDGPRAVADVRREPAYADAPILEQLAIGTYLGVPIGADDDGVFGTLCGLQPAVHPDGDALALVRPYLEGVARSLAATIAMDVRAARLQRRLDLAETAARRDPLTGIGNRRAWQRAMRAEDARCERFGHHAGVLVVDLDGLKFVNDTQGHGAGDRLIRRAATALAGTCRSTDSVYRTGGDEFALLVPETTDDGLAKFRDRVIDALDRAQVDASVGSAMRTAHADMETAFARADDAMQTAKPHLRGAGVRR